ncbi:putative S-adenosyl-L-methionine-dependent methyltransferase [Rosa chinensis]|uniref:Putative S-adenosyl-L-methionine-dependent methyltransferase n=1 Tax=Rosa chinensis TaxID=74649 RepID=A0A2P6PKT8_ROSCH|nr:probable methyltransferase PMT24 [Rosa chinensis]PRQ22547.1 putative S-adenosyl-L-methionine-dependent methyltransferase [Rosa chinensis]
MAMGKYSRVDGKKSLNCCSTTSLVVFVAFCLVGVWMLMSSVVPIQSQNVSTEENLTDKSSKHYEDSSGGLSETVTREDDSGSDSQSETNIENTQNVSQDESVSTSEEKQEEVVSKEVSEEKVESESENGDEGNQQEKFVKETSDEKSETEEEPKTENENDGDAKVNDQEASSGDGQSNSEAGSTEEASGKTSENEQTELEGEKKSEGDESADEKKQEDDVPSQTDEEKVENNQDNNSEEGDTSNNMDSEKETEKSSISETQSEYSWKLCNVTAGPDYIPCLDNWKTIRKLSSTMHYEHRERHCPEEASTCLVSLPEGYRRPIQWPTSREKIWYHNVPHTKLAVVKGHQNWVKVTGEYLTFPGGGTQFKNGALHYIDFIQNSLPDIAWGKRSRVILDVGCGVASFGGFLFDRDVLAMSFAPKDEHEAQVQFALERGIPAISAVMGTTRLPYPSSVFDLIHCARCRVPWHVEGGKLLLELNRVLRPGGYFVWSATPVYQKLPEDVGIWKAMSELTKSICWDLVVIKKDKLNQVAAAIYRKPSTNECYNERAQNEPPLCSESDDPNAAWKVPLEACIHKVPEDASDRGSQWPLQWPSRLEKPPYWLKSQLDVNGKSAPEDFISDYKHWKNVVSKTYLTGMGIDWSSVRNVLDMRAVYGGFAAALKDLKVWVMNVVPPIDSRDTLAIIFERGLIGMYHDWCESFSTYPRTYDVVHADHLFSVLKKRCNLVAVIAEVDRILRPEGKLIVWDDAETLNEIESMAKSLQWDIRFTYSKDNKGLLCIQKTFWRPTEQETILSAIA